MNNLSSKRASDSDIQQIIDSTEKGTTMFVPADVYYLIAKELLALREAGKEPVAYMYRDRMHKDARFSYEPRLGNWSPEDISEYEITETKLYAAPQLPAVPEGWVVVPIEPTDEMTEAMYRHHITPRNALKAAIAAAPKPEA